MKIFNSFQEVYNASCMRHNDWCGSDNCLTTVTSKLHRLRGKQQELSRTKPVDNFDAGTFAGGGIISKVAQAGAGDLETITGMSITK